MKLLLLFILPFYIYASASASYLVKKMAEPLF